MDCSEYALVDDGDEKNNTSHRLLWWHKVGFVLLATGCVLGLASQSTTVKAPARAVEFLEKPLRPEVLTAFQGSTVQYGGYGSPSGGHFSATLQVHHAGSKDTSFLLDHRLQYIVDGEVHITDGTDQHFVGKPGDLFYLAYGSNVTQYTPQSAVTYVSIADEAPSLQPGELATLQPEAYRKWVGESARTTRVVHFPQIKDKRDRVFGDQHIFFDGLGCWKYNSSRLISNDRTRSPTWNFCCGIFHLTAGPPAFTSSTYKNHEELDFIIGGEFNAKDATGQMFPLKKGDLVHNPRHMNVEYTTPTSGTFLSTSLSPVDDFFPH